MKKQIMNCGVCDFFKRMYGESLKRCHRPASAQCPMNVKKPKK